MYNLIFCERTCHFSFFPDLTKVMKCTIPTEATSMWEHFSHIFCSYHDFRKRGCSTKSDRLLGSKCEILVIFDFLLDLKLSHTCVEKCKIK